MERYKAVVAPPTLASLPTFRADIPAAAQILVAREEGNRRRHSTDHIEKICKIAFDNGALAGKISGACGGGFIILIVPP
jgi:galactokinase/mevalonate kinase-like predicted kinase